MFDYRNQMSGFTKLFSTIVHSTVWQEPMHIKVVWVTMLALANQKGEVPVSVPGLAVASGVSMDQCIEAVARLSGPDVWSRTKAHEGRRIEAIEGGFRLLNHGKYRDMRNADERRIQVREAVAKHRKSKVKSAVIHGKPEKAQAEAEAEAEAEITISGETAKPSSPPVLVFPCDGKLREWHLSSEQVAEWSTFYPSLDVTQQCRHALAWVLANPGRKKTASGMPSFLNRWLARTQDRAGSSEGKPSVRQGGTTEYKRA